MCFYQDEIATRFHMFVATHIYIKAESQHTSPALPVSLADDGVLALLTLILLLLISRKVEGVVVFMPRYPLVSLYTDELPKIILPLVAFEVELTIRFPPGEDPLLINGLNNEVPKYAVFHFAEELPMFNLLSEPEKKPVEFNCAI